MYMNVVPSGAPMQSKEGADPLRVQKRDGCRYSPMTGVKQGQKIGWIMKRIPMKTRGIAKKGGLISASAVHD
jgi:hypothetical protein